MATVFRIEAIQLTTIPATPGLQILASYARIIRGRRSSRLFERSCRHTRAWRIPRHPGQEPRARGRRGVGPSCDQGCARSLSRSIGVVVSTDSEAIALVGATAGAEIIRRPAELAGDDASTESALLHALDLLGPPEPGSSVTGSATSPLRRSQTIDACVRRALETGADSVLTVRETRDVLGNVADGIFVRLDPEQPRRRQLRRPLYSEAGTVYVTRTEYLRAKGSILGAEPLAFVVSAEEAIDVNAPIDLRLAQVVADSS